MAIHYAHLVMLAEQRIVPRDGRARASATRSTRSRSGRGPRASRYDGTYEDLFFYVERLIVAGLRRGRGRPAAHRALAQRHRHDDVPDAAARADPGARRGVAAAARACCSTSPRATATTCSPRTPTPSRRSRPPSRTTCWRSSSSSSATPCGCRRPTPAPTGIRSARARSPAPGFRSIATARPTLLGFDGADRQHLRQHRHRRLPARERVGDRGAARRARPRRAGSAALVHQRVRLPAAGGRLRAVQQHHAAEAQPGRARARARDRQQGASARRSAIVLAVHNTPFGDIVDTEDDLQPLVFSMFRDAGAGGPSGRGGDGLRARSTARGWPSGRRKGWITVTELADTLARDHGVPFKAGHTIASRWSPPCAARREGRARELLREISAEVLGRRDRDRRRGAGARSSARSTSSRCGPRRAARRRHGRRRPSRSRERRSRGIAGGSRRRRGGWPPQKNS